MNVLQIPCHESVDIMAAVFHIFSCDGDGDGVGGAVLRVFPCGTYATKTVSSPLVAKN